jgi:peptidoglycan/LPS O-acetylase OafA/YrhL
VVLAGADRARKCLTPAAASARSIAVVRSVLQCSSPSFPRQRIEFFSRCGLALGIVVIAFAFLLFGAGAVASPFLLARPLYQIFFAFLGPFYLFLLIIAMSGGVLTRILESPPIRYCGRISYGLYLYHWPILVLVDSVADLKIGAKSALTIGATFVVATLSYHWLERPILNAKDRLFPRQKQKS